jgi:hypothetical protein
MSYIRFGLMILTSTVVMFILMYLNTYAWEHVFFSETRIYMAIMMGATMAVIMLAYMLGMYSNMRLNITIFVGRDHRVRVVALARPQPGHSLGSELHAGYDPTPLDRDNYLRTSADP